MMKDTMINLKILLPSTVFADISGIRKIGIETTGGAYGFLPQRLDCTASLVPGILLYETENEDIKYIAIDEGIMVKTGAEVLVSVRNAIGGAPLGELRTLVEKEMMKLDESEVSARSVMAKLESGFIRSFQKLIKE